MKWVTFYWSVLDGVADLIVHKDKDAATEYFKRSYRAYFQLGYKTKVKLPMSFGYAHRKFIGMSMRSFKKHFEEKAGGEE